MKVICTKCFSFSMYEYVFAEGTVCVGHVARQWMRSQVLSCTEESAMVVLLDVGGVLNLPTSDLRQIRYDYMTLPFQASQCLLHGIQPVGGKRPCFLSS